LTVETSRAGRPTAAAPWRVAIITVLPQVAQGYAAIVRRLGHDPVAVIAARRRAPGAPPSPFAAAHVADDPEELDVLFAASRRSLARLLRGCEADLGLCTGFPWLVPADAIATPPLGIVNGHPSLLPRYRGPFPVAWAVRNGETEIGLSYHLMDDRFDTGNVLAQAPVPLSDEDTEETLYAKVEETAPALLATVFDRLAKGDRGDPQEGGEYQSGFGEDYLYVDPAQTAAEVHRQARAWSFVPAIGDRGPVLDRPGGRVRLARTSLTEVEGAERLECADGPLWILESEPVEFS
jgi:methionyl-tRNA formyltransferase